MSQSDLTKDSRELSLRAKYPQLEIPGLHGVMGADEIEVENIFTKMRGGIGDRPLGRSVRSLMTKAGIEPPPGLDFGTRYKHYLIPNYVWVMVDGGITSPASVGLQLEFCNEDLDEPLNPGAMCQVSAMQPDAAFIVTGELGVKFASKAALSFSGSVGSIAEELGDLEVNASLGGLDIGTSNSVTGKLVLWLRCYTPKIGAVGVGGTYAEWCFTHHGDTPLFNKNLETWTVLLVDASWKEVTYRARMYVVASTLYMRTRHQSDWITLTCELGD